MNREDIYKAIKNRVELEGFKISKIDSDSIKIDLISEEFRCILL
ncbi:hypothetical protein [Zobellia laminariae]|nr:hypothetical protein [Zobellia laminariae]WKX78229.1 hypothetical protein Q5W13_10180 [Zobellia laminariae]